MTAFVISSFVAAAIFFIMIFLIAYVLCKTTIVNEYTKIAYVELLIAVSLRTIFCILEGIYDDKAWID